MTDRPLASAYAALLSDLAAVLSRDFTWPSPEASFASFVFHRAGEEGPVPKPRTLTWPSSDRLVHAPSLAAAGYWLASGEGLSLRSSWLDGVDRLSRRDAFPSDRQSFVYRPIELLGVAVGLAACAGSRPELLTWLQEIIERLGKEQAGDVWSVVSRHAAGLALGGASTVAMPQLAGATLEDRALIRWVSTVLASSTTTKDADAALLRRALLEGVEGADLAKHAVLYQALRSTVADVIESEVDQHWQVGRRERDAEALVRTLCRRFHLFAQQLLDRHDKRATVELVDEYDVQDVMHALLKLHFEDVRSEEVTPSVGGKSGRMDFLLKSERLAVETKMTRERLDQKAVGDELIVDMRRYRSHPDYRTLVCFVYDPDGFCHAPASLENDLSGQEGDFRTVVIVCPKGM